MPPSTRTRCRPETPAIVTPGYPPTWTLVLGVIASAAPEDAKPPVPVEEIEQIIADRKAARQPARFRGRPTPSGSGLADRGQSCSRTGRRAHAGSRK
jgi:hypothetical protein